MDDRLEKLIFRRFSHSHMSNTKWRKLFRVLAEPELGLQHSYWKFVDDERVFQHGIPMEFDLLEDGMADGRFVPLPYCAIEWIEIPSEHVLEENRELAFRRAYKQEVGKVLAAINQIGQFMTELTDTGLRIYGYS